MLNKLYEFRYWLIERNLGKMINSLYRTIEGLTNNNAKLDKIDRELQEDIAHKSIIKDRVKKQMTNNNIMIEKVQNFLRR